MRGRNFWNPFLTFGILHILYGLPSIDCIQKSHLKSNVQTQAMEFPILGQPYPLPDIEVSDSPSLKDQAISPKHESERPTTEMNVELDNVGDDQSKDSEPPAISAVLINSIKNSIKAQHQVFKKLTDQIEQLRKNLKENREEVENSKLVNEKSGSPDKLILELAFPSAQALNNKVETLKVSPSETSNSTATNATETEKPQIISLSKTLLPIPIVYVSEDAETKLKELLKNARDVAEEGIMFDEKEAENIALLNPRKLAHQIEELQKLSDKLSSAIAYMKSDAELVSHLVKSHEHGNPPSKVSE